jgi:hypothetical protein
VEDGKRRGLELSGEIRARQRRAAKAEARLQADAGGCDICKEHTSSRVHAKRRHKRRESGEATSSQDKIP